MRIILELSAFAVKFLLLHLSARYTRCVHTSVIAGDVQWVLRFQSGVDRSGRGPISGLNERQYQLGSAQDGSPFYLRCQDLQYRVSFLVACFPFIEGYSRLALLARLINRQDVVFDE